MINALLSLFHVGSVASSDPVSSDVPEDKVTDVAQSVFEKKMKDSRTQMDHEALLLFMYFKCTVSQKKLERQTVLIETLNLQNYIFHLQTHLNVFLENLPSIRRTLQNEALIGPCEEFMLNFDTIVTEPFNALEEMNEQILKTSSIKKIKLIIEMNGIIFNKKFKKDCLAHNISLPNFSTDQETIKRVAKASLYVLLSECFVLDEALKRCCTPLSRFGLYHQHLQKHCSQLAARVDTIQYTQNEFSAFWNEISHVKQAFLDLQEVCDQIRAENTAPPDYSDLHSRIRLMYLKHCESLNIPYPEGFETHSDCVRLPV